MNDRWRRCWIACATMRWPPSLPERSEVLHPVSDIWSCSSSDVGMKSAVMVGPSHRARGWKIEAGRWNRRPLHSRTMAEAREPVTCLSEFLFSEPPVGDGYRGRKARASRAIEIGASKVAVCRQCANKLVVAKQGAKSPQQEN